MCRTSATVATATAFEIFEPVASPRPRPALEPTQVKAVCPRFAQFSMSSSETMSRCSFTPSAASLLNRIGLRPAWLLRCAEMSRFDDANNALGYIVVQLAAHASKAAEIAKNAREAYETASVFMQEQLRANQEQKQAIEKQEKELEKVKEALGIALSKERVASETPAEPKPEGPAPKPEEPVPTPQEPAPTPDEKKEEKPKEGAWSRTIDIEAHLPSPAM